VLALRAAIGIAAAGSLVLDMGSGSGVLAVALAKTAGAVCECHDISTTAEHALEHNARLNGVAPAVRWRGALSGADAGRYDLAVANILAPVLRDMAAELTAAVRPGGALVLSGIRENQVDELVARYELCTVHAVDTLDGWVAVTLGRVS